MPEYKFAVEKCGCGQKLLGQKVELEGMKAHIPMGRCHKCGTAHPLVEIESEPATEPEAEPATEPEAEPAETPPAEPTETPETEPGEGPAEE